MQNHKLDEIDLIDTMKEQKESLLSMEKNYNRLTVLEEHYKHLAIKADFLAMNIDKINNKWKDWLADFFSKIGNKIAWIIVIALTFGIVVVFTKPELIRELFTLLGVLK